MWQSVFRQTGGLPRYGHRFRLLQHRSAGKVTSFRQPKISQTIKDRDKRVVEHKGVYPKLGSEAVINLQAQSLTWDTLFAEVSQISLVGKYLQSSHQLAWDTLSHLEITEEIAGILKNFLVHRHDPPVRQLSENIWRILQKFLFADSRRPTVKKTCPEAASWWLTG
jgi:hypothetical protein